MSDIQPDETEVPSQVPEVQTYEPEVPSQVPEVQTYEPEVPSQVPEVIPDVIDLNKLMSEQQVIVQRELDLKKFFNDTLISVPLSTFKPKLIEWATSRFPILFPIWSVDVSIPDVCSDGVSRTLVSYIEYCIGMSVSDLIVMLQAKFIDIVINYTLQESRFSIVVLKA